MKRLALVASLVVFAACAPKAEEAPAADAAATTPAPAATTDSAAATTDSTKTDSTAAKADSAAH